MIYTIVIKKHIEIEYTFLSLSYTSIKPNLFSEVYNRIGEKTEFMSKSIVSKDKNTILSFKNILLMCMRGARKKTHNI